MEKGGRKPALRAVCKEELAGWLAEIHMEANTARARPGRGPLTPERTVQCRTGPSKRKQPLPNIRTHASVRLPSASTEGFCLGTFTPGVLIDLRSGWKPIPPAASVFQKTED